MTHRLVPAWLIPLLFATWAAFATAWTAASAQDRTRDPGDIDAGSRLKPELIEIPTGDGSERKLLVNLLRPSGAGPFRLAIMNHGSPTSGGRPEMAVPTFPVLSRWLLERRFAVALPRSEEHTSEL